jgi:hypothetical protein
MNRPTSVTVFGILNIVFAVFGVLATLGSVALFLPQMTNGSNPVIKLIHENATYATWLKLSIGLGLLVSVALLAAGIGLLQLKPWARIFSIGYAVYSLVMIPASMLVNFFLLTRPLLAQAHQQHGPEAAGAIGAAIGGLFGSCFGLIYPVLLLIFMLRANVKAAFIPVPTSEQ